MFKQNKKVRAASGSKSSSKAAGRAGKGKNLKRVYFFGPGKTEGRGIQRRCRLAVSRKCGSGHGQQDGANHISHSAYFSVRPSLSPRIPKVNPPTAHPMRNTEVIWPPTAFAAASSWPAGT